MAENNKMSITTKTGDKGTTSLYSGERVFKNSPRPEAYGDADELCSLLGIARLHCVKEETKEAVLYIQRCLFVVSSELATTPETLERLPDRIDDAMLAKLDQHRDDLEAIVPSPKGFVIPGGSLASAHLDLARAVSRRVERKTVGLLQDGLIANELLITWLNRLSDYLYLLARFEDDNPILVNSISVRDA